MSLLRHATTGFGRETGGNPAVPNLARSLLILRHMGVGITAGGPIASKEYRMSFPFALDRTNRKLMGVCAGLARSTGVDVLPIRVALVLLTIFALGPVALLVYILIGWLADAR